MLPDAAATFEEIVHARHSVRGFRPDPVPDALIRRALAIAQQAPSNCNTQTWTVHIVSGAAAERLRTALHDASASGRVPDPDLPLLAYDGPYRERQIDAAKALFAATGVMRDDRVARRESLLRNYRFFDAPHAALLLLPKPYGAREAVDCGMFAQTLMLAFTAFGIASCAQGALAHHAGIARSTLGIDAGQQLLFGIAFGWEDAAHPANATRVGRVPLGEAAVFHA